LHDIQRFGRRFESSGPKPSTNHLSALPVTETTPREILARDTGADRQLTQSSHSRPAWSMPSGQFVGHNLADAMLF
jgi:hypothetical protein